MLGEVQVARGYCLLLPDPVVPHLNAMAPDVRLAFMDDMARLGDAVLQVTGAVRVNYEMLGNLEPALHAHVVPRHDTEPESVRTKAIWFHDWDAAPRFDAVGDAPLLDALRHELACRQA